MYGAKNGFLTHNGARTDYIRFGHGTKSLILLPGMSAGLRTVKGAAQPMSYIYRAFAKEYTVYAISCRSTFPHKYSTFDMANDLARAMDSLRISKADVVGISLGGMICQHLAAHHPERVGKLVLASTAAKTTPTLLECLTEWTDHALRADHAGLMDSNLRRIYTEEYYRKKKSMINFVGKFSHPSDYTRFFIQAEACGTHDATDILSKISAPTLVIGGEKDIAVGGSAAKDLAELIPNATLHMYPQFGHGLYDEAKDFQQVVLSFLHG